MAIRLPVFTCALCALALAACGSGDDGDGSAQGPRERTTPQRDPLAPPPSVPDRPDRAPARPEQARVIRAWADALRAGDVDRAVSYWAVPSRAQNGTPLLLLGSRSAVREFNAALTCGAVVTSTRRAGGYTIVRFRLAERPGGDCGPAVGASASSAIRVRRGKIVEWYRLPETPPREAPEPDPPPVEREGGPVV